MIQYRPDIDGLRAIAVLSVVLFHAFPSFLKGGFVGVDIFFVISGFLITTIILRDVNNGTFSFKKFYANRVRRIFPALSLILIFCLAIGWIVLTPPEYEFLGKHIAAGALFINNFVFWNEAGYFDSAADTKPLLHLWSLGIEEQFYMAWPPLLLVTWRKYKSLKMPIIVFGVISFGYGLFVVRYDNVAAFYSPFTRIWELLFGGGLAYLLFRKPDVAYQEVWGWLGLALIFFAIISIKPGGSFPGKKALFPVIGAACIILGRDSYLNRRVLSTYPFVWFGLISYPLYLWHWPLMSFARILESETPSIYIRISLVFLSIVLAWVTYWILERPFRFGFLKKRSVIVLSTSVVLLLVTGIAVMKFQGLKYRLQPMLNGDPNTMKLGTDKDKLANSCGVPEKYAGLFQFCMSDSIEKPRYAIIGDSKAEALFYGLARESKQNHRWLLVGEVNYQEDQVKDIQQLKNDRALEAIEKNPNLGVVLLANALRNTFTIDRDTGFIAGVIPRLVLDRKVENYTRLIERLENAGKRVAFVIDNPTFPNPTSCISGGLTSSLTLNKFLRRKENPNCTISYNDYIAGMRPYLEFVQKLRVTNSGLIIIDPTPMLCDVAKNICTVTSDRKFLYSYTDHISDYASSLIAKKILPTIEYFGIKV